MSSTATELREPRPAALVPPVRGVEVDQQGPASASALTYTGAAWGQARSNPSLGLRTPMRVGAGEPSGETRGSGMEAALVVHFCLAGLPGRVESFSDDLVQQPGDASIRLARRHFEAGLHR